MGVCFLCWFTWFDSLALFLKHLFSPILFFLGSTFSRPGWGVLPESLGARVAAVYVEPCCAHAGGYDPSRWWTTGSRRGIILAGLV